MNNFVIFVKDVSYAHKAALFLNTQKNRNIVTFKFKITFIVKCNLLKLNSQNYYSSVT